MADIFLAINKKHLNLGLKSVDVLIIAQIEEFERNNRQCYLTNKYFADIFGESESTIKRSIDKLEGFNIIKRSTAFIKGNGKSNKQRVLSLCNRNKWKVQIEPSKMEGSKINDGRFKNDEWKGHNEPIKDNKKDKEKDNIKTKTTLDLIKFSDKIQEDIDLGLAMPEDYMSDNFYSYITEERDRLGEALSFVVYDNKIECYKDGKCMGLCHGMGE